MATSIPINKKDLSERDICSKFIGPAVKRAGWEGMLQIREEVAFTKGRIIVRGKLVTRGNPKRAEYILVFVTSQSAHRLLTLALRGLTCRLHTDRPSRTGSSRISP